MPWKPWSRERLTSPQFQEYIQDQTVLYYASASARDNELGASVKDGMVCYLADRDAIYMRSAGVWRPVHPGAVRARGGFARTDGAATLNTGGDGFTNLTLHPGLSTAGGGWGSYNPGNTLGHTNSLPGRYQFACNLRTNTGADRWEALIAIVNGAELPIADGAVLGGFSGLSGGDVIDAPAGISIGARYITNSGVAGAIRDGSWWSLTYLGPIP
jgi:hypothetical protein